MVIVGQNHDLASKAAENYRYYKNNTPHAIAYLTQQTTLYTANSLDYSPRPQASNKTKILLSANSTVDTLKELYNEDERICILNFASYKNPGGGYGARRGPMPQLLFI